MVKHQSQQEYSDLFKKAEFFIQPSSISYQEHIILSNFDLNEIESMIHQYKQTGTIDMNEVLRNLRGGNESVNWLFLFALFHLLDQHYTDGAFIPAWLNPLSELNPRLPKLPKQNK